MQLFVPTIWIGSGISFFAGAQFCVYGLIRRQERVFFAFGLLCLLLGLYMTFSARWYHAGSIAALAQIAKFEMGIICLVYPAVIWFLSLYTYEKAIGKFHLAIILGYGILFVINLWSPYSFLYESIQIAKPVMLPWGEIVNRFVFQTTPIAIPYYVLTYIVFGWAFVRSYTLWRNDHKTRAVSITVYLLLQFLVILHAELIDNLSLKSVYLGEFAFLGLVVLVTGTMILEVRARYAALEESIVSLRQETGRRKEYEKQLNYIAHHDYLTELPNRRALTEQLNSVIMRCARTNTHGAMLLIDLDHFKMINDSLGHDLGDQLLQLIARRLESLLPVTEPPVRLGGDEFAVLCAGLDRNEPLAKEQALELARDISSEIIKPYHVAEHELVIGASIGIAVFDGESHATLDTVKHADMALYCAKSAGRNSLYVFAPQLKHDADQRLAIERHLRVAIEHDELALYFQPQVNMDGGILGAEVLARWHHPELGTVPPKQFITVAEESGLIHVLGEYVLRQACQYLNKWRASDSSWPTRLSVNVSPWQIGNPGFVAMVKQVIEETAIDPRGIVLEITESTFMRDLQGVSEKIHKLNDIGVSFSIDDFGTGYSALAWLKKLPLSELKIDRMFIHEMSLTSRDKVIDTILAIARHMDMRVVAEGVETLAQRTALESLACRYFQGFLISAALPEADFIKWVQHHSELVT